ncbi:MAG TPA: enoyl-CoA hydratase-related protein, partial [Rhabdaerophilum sp.]|nr:enoyl-CoA hydratase-related protein [Rhabdaerophilum sp.]
MSAYETILTEIHGRVALIRFNRPQALNAINLKVTAEVTAALQGFDADPAIGAIVITGSEKAFAAGADIKEMQDLGYPESLLRDFGGGWDVIPRIR